MTCILKKLIGKKTHSIISLLLNRNSIKLTHNSIFSRISFSLKKKKTFLLLLEIFVNDFFYLFKIMLGKILYKILLKKK